MWKTIWTQFPRSRNLYENLDPSGLICFIIVACFLILRLSLLSCKIVSINLIVIYIYTFTRNGHRETRSRCYVKIGYLKRYRDLEKSQV